MPVTDGQKWIAAATVAACAVAASGANGREQARFRTTTDAVQVDVQVTARGRPIGGLTAGDFELRDSGVRQTIQAIAFEDVPLSLLLVLDTSASVEGEARADLEQAAREAVGALRPGDQAALLTFSSRIALETGWTSDRAALEKAIDGLETGGWTALHDAVLSGLALREEAAGRTLLLVFTDGADTTSWLDPDVVITAAQRSDLVVVAVSAAERPRPDSAIRARDAFGLDAMLRRAFDTDPSLFPYAFLERLTSETGGELFQTRGRDLAQVFARIVADFKSRYLLTYAPEGVPASGWHPIEVRLTRRSGDVRARRGYWR